MSADAAVLYAAVLYSSGTTGTSKSAILTHAAVEMDDGCKYYIQLNQSKLKLKVHSILKLSRRQVNQPQQDLLTNRTRLLVIFNSFLIRDFKVRKSPRKL